MPRMKTNSADTNLKKRLAHAESELKKTQKQAKIVIKEWEAKCSAMKQQLENQLQTSIAAAYENGFNDALNELENMVVRQKVVSHSQGYHVILYVLIV